MVFEHGLGRAITHITYTATGAALRSIAEVRKEGTRCHVYTPKANTEASTVAWPRFYVATMKATIRSQNPTIKILDKYCMFIIKQYYLSGRNRRSNMKKHILLHLSYKKIKFLSESNHRHNPFKGCFPPSRQGVT